MKNKEKTFIYYFALSMSIMFGRVAVAGRGEAPSCSSSSTYSPVSDNNQPLNDTSSLSSISEGNIGLPPDLQKEIDGYNRYVDTPEMRKLFSGYLKAKKNFETLVPTEFQTPIKEYMQALAEIISIEELDVYKNELNEQFRFLELIINALENTELSSYRFRFLELIINALENTELSSYRFRFLELIINALKNTELSSYREVMRLKEILSEETDPILRMAKIRKEIVSSIFDNSRIDEFFTRRNRDPFFIERINKPLTNGGPVGSVTDRLTDDEFNIGSFEENLPNDVETKRTELNNKYNLSYKYAFSYSVKLVHLALYNRMIEAKKKLDDCNQKLH